MLVCMYCFCVVVVVVVVVVCMNNRIPKHGYIVKVKFTPNSRLLDELRYEQLNGESCGLAVEHSAHDR